MSIKGLHLFSACAADTPGTEASLTFICKWEKEPDELWTGAQLLKKQLYCELTVNMSYQTFPSLEALIYKE